MKKTTVFCFAGFFCCLSFPALATNGMLLEGYGPISQALGGSSMAFDHGAAAMNANPATFGLMADGNRIDLAVGMLRPRVTWETPMGDYKSRSTEFFMPAAGYVRKEGDWAYGVGVFSQGGMGTDFQPEQPMFSQVNVGKVMVPLAYNVSEKLAIGATAEFVWAGMDLKMQDIFDFQDASGVLGAARGGGVSASLGAVYKATDWLNVGGAYQFRSFLNDLKGEGATVKGFNFPSSLAAGISARVTDDLTFVADYKWVQWSGAMKTITISQNNVTMEMKQDWRDQHVFSFGASYDVSSDLTLRGGVSLANNPVVVNCSPLFPAIIENHFTGGFGWKITDSTMLNASVAYAPKVRQANADMMGMPSNSVHSQINSTLMLSFLF